MKKVVGHPCVVIIAATACQRNKFILEPASEERIVARVTPLPYYGNNVPEQDYYLLQRRLEQVQPEQQLVTSVSITPKRDADYRLLALTIDATRSNAVLRTDS